MYWCCCVCVRAGKVVSRTMVVNGSVSLSTATGAMNLFLLRPSTKRYHAVGSVSRKSPVSTENEIGKSGFLHGSRKIALSIHLFSTEHAHSVEKICFRLSTHIQSKKVVGLTGCARRTGQSKTLRKTSHRLSHHHKHTPTHPYQVPRYRTVVSYNSADASLVAITVSASRRSQHGTFLLL